MDKWLRIVVTSPDPVPDESRRIDDLLRAGVDYVHLRKPSASTDEMRALIEEIDYSHRSRLRLHGHFCLLDDYNLAGAHLNSRNPSAPASARSLTRSCHSLLEIRELPPETYSYVTLSPVFDSISKPGYSANPSLADVKGIADEQRIVALGGVTPEHFPRLRQAGFAGAALLGFVWNNPSLGWNEILQQLMT